MESVIGFIKQKNETGILVEGKWYNPSDNVKTFYAQCKVNNKVKMQVEGSVIHHIQKLDYTSKEFKQCALECAVNVHCAMIRQEKPNAMDVTKIKELANEFVKYLKGDE